MRAEFCIFESNAPGLKANFYEPYVDKPSRDHCCWWKLTFVNVATLAFFMFQHNTVLLVDPLP